MLQKLFEFFLLQEARAFGNNIAKEPQNPRPKLKEYFICLQSSASGSFLQKCINFVEQQPKFSDSITTLRANLCLAQQSLIFKFKLFYS